MNSNSEKKQSHFGLDSETLEKIQTCLSNYPEITWVKIYGSRAKGNYKAGSDIDLAFSATRDISARLFASLDVLSTPYLFDVTHYESILNLELKAHIDRVGIQVYPTPKNNF